MKASSISNKNTSFNDYLNNKLFKLSLLSKLDKDDIDVNDLEVPEYKNTLKEEVVIKISPQAKLDNIEANREIIDILKNEVSFEKLIASYKSHNLLQDYINIQNIVCYDLGEMPKCIEKIKDLIDKLSKYANDKDSPDLCNIVDLLKTKIEKIKENKINTEIFLSNIDQIQRLIYSEGVLKVIFQ